MSRYKKRFSFLYFFLLLRIILVMFAIQVMLKLLSLPKLMDILTPRKNIKGTPQEDIDRIIKIIDNILNQRVFIFYPTCLKRSLVLYYFLNKYGLNVVMNFGVKKNNDKLDGHGWLTLDGKPYLEAYDPHDSFTVTYSYPHL